MISIPVQLFECCGFVLGSESFFCSKYLQIIQPKGSRLMLFQELVFNNNNKSNDLAD